MAASLEVAFPTIWSDVHVEAKPFPSLACELERHFAIAVELLQPALNAKANAHDGELAQHAERDGGRQQVCDDGDKADGGGDGDGRDGYDYYGDRQQGSNRHQRLLPERRSHATS
ncbi:hypothetical protein G7Y89_g8368 [Cudoniella acicularis]|uniref:Uncharacterized protein n=1 Tax=Cudoniella acicularis TaxID=354080 RepID=A0A8H4W3M9_9HELO|nr:hypothetical protein G7Y89_g8368 [Cudoniella acicularis]